MVSNHFDFTHVLHLIATTSILLSEPHVILMSREIQLIIKD